MFKRYPLGGKSALFEPACSYFSHNSAAIPLKMSFGRTKNCRFSHSKAKFKHALRMKYNVPLFLHQNLCQG